MNIEIIIMKIGKEMPKKTHRIMTQNVVRRFTVSL